MSGGVWTLEGYNIGTLVSINQGVSAQSTEMSVWGQPIDSAYVWETGGPIGRITLMTERRNPYPPEPWAGNPSNADFIEVMEDLFNESQLMAGPYKLKIIPQNTSQYRARSYNVFISAFSYGWQAGTPDLLYCNFTFTRRSPE